LALKDSVVWAWGDNTYGQMGNGSSGGYQLYAEELASVRKTPDRQREGSYLSVRSAFWSQATRPASAGSRSFLL